MRMLRLTSEASKKTYELERSHISILDLRRINPEFVSSKNSNLSVAKRVTHSAEIKRSYTPLLEKYRRSLILPPEMPDEERDRIRQMRQDPFNKRSAGTGVVIPRNMESLQRCVAGNLEWNHSTHYAADVDDAVDEPRTTTCSPRALKTSHRGIAVTPVGRMIHDISFRQFEYGALATAVKQSNQAGGWGRDTPRVGATPPLASGSRSAPSSAPRRVGRTARLPATPGGYGPPPAPPAMMPAIGHTPRRPRGVPLSGLSGDLELPDVSSPPSPASRHGRMGFHHGGLHTHVSVTGNEDAELMRVVASFNELKRKALLLDTISVHTQVLSAEQFVRIEDDFLRVTKGRKSRILTPDDFDADIKMGGNVITRRRLTFLMSKESGGALTFFQLVQYVFPNVSTSQFDAYLLQHSTSMNPLLGGPLEVRAAPEVYRAIQKFYRRFDDDGDGKVYIHDIEAKQRVLFANAEAANQNSTGRSSMAEEFEAAGDHLVSDETGYVSLEAFAKFSRFLFPPYRLLAEDDYE